MAIKIFHDFFIQPTSKKNKEETHELVTAETRYPIREKRFSPARRFQGYLLRKVYQGFKLIKCADSVKFDACCLYVFKSENCHAIVLK